MSVPQQDPRRGWEGEGAEGEAPFPPTLQVPAGPLPPPRVPWILNMPAERTESWLGVWDILIPKKKHCLSEIGTCLHSEALAQAPGGWAGEGVPSGGGAQVGRGAGAEEREAVPELGRGGEWGGEGSGQEGGAEGGEGF